jgi:hypothetical protein
MRPGRDAVEAWQFTRGIDVHSARRATEERGALGDVRVAVLTAGPGWLRVAVEQGAPRSGSLLFLNGRGLFEVTRRDEWPAGGGRGRVLLMLRAVSAEAPVATAGQTRR